MNLRELVQFHAELETTARMGYQRILELTRLLDAQTKAAAQDVLGLTFDLDIAKIRCEENFHEDAFREMARWVAEDGESFRARPRSECAHILHDLCERNLSVPALRRILSPSTVIPKGEELGAPWVSDGGLGELFASCALPVPVLTTADLTARLSA
jgi:hypothetical protein